MKPFVFLISSFFLLSCNNKEPESLECLNSCGGNPATFGFDADQYQLSDIDTVVVRAYKKEDDSTIQSEVTYYAQDIVQPIAVGQRSVYTFEPSLLLYTIYNYEVEVVSTGQNFMVTNIGEPTYTFMLNCAEERKCEFKDDVADVSGGNYQIVHSELSTSSTTYYIVFKK